MVLVSVVALALSRNCERETPCSASFHQPHGCTPRRGIAGERELEIVCEAFSDSVMRETRSAARSANE